MLNSKCNPKYFSNPKLPECSMLSLQCTMVKNFNGPGQIHQGENIPFFKKSIKIYKGSCQKIFLRYVVMSSSVWWSQASQASTLTLHPHYVACFSLPPTFLSSTRHSVTILIKYFWHILNIFIHFSRVNVLAKIGPNIFGDYWANLQHRTETGTDLKGKIQLFSLNIFPDLTNIFS